MKILKQDELEKIEATTSKGNQTKYYHKETKSWIKVDNLGYESLAEIIVSRVLESLDVGIPFVKYSPCHVNIDGNNVSCCISESFIKDNYTEISVYKLIKKMYSIDLYEELANKTTTDKIIYVVDSVKSITGIKDFEKYLSIVLQLDYLFLNEDRHFNNIVFLRDDYTKQFNLSPLFDNGLSLLSDINRDYPLLMNLTEAINLVKSKPFSIKFENQVNIVLSLYDNKLKLEPYYSIDISDLYLFFKAEYIERSIAVIEYQFRKLYPYTTIEFVTEGNNGETDMFN